MEDGDSILTWQRFAPAHHFPIRASSIIDSVIMTHATCFVGSLSSTSEFDGVRRAGPAFH